jgi:hypothetical protein
MRRPGLKLRSEQQARTPPSLLTWKKYLELGVGLFNNYGFFGVNYVLGNIVPGKTKLIIE